MKCLLEQENKHEAIGYKLTIQTNKYIPFDILENPLFWDKYQTTDK
jgi:hypothetical protein